MITSSSNTKVKQVMNLQKKAKARQESGLFVAEGVRMYAELPRDRIDTVFVSKSFIENSQHKKLLCDTRYEVVSDDVFSFMSDTKTPQGILALVRCFEYTVEELFSPQEPAFLIILEAIQDPGNLGTILRAGEGAGVTGVVTDSQTADIYNPKVIRSTMGSVCRVPFICTKDLYGTLGQIKARGVHLFAAHLKGERPYDQETYTGGVGFLIGNEANGLSLEVAAEADTLVRIPMKGAVESLNAAVAASVLMFEAARQRRR